MGDAGHAGTQPWDGADRAVAVGALASEAFSSEPSREEGRAVTTRALWVPGREGW